MNSNPKSIIVVNGVLQSAEELKLKNGFKNYSLKKKFSNEENIQINKNNICPQYSIQKNYYQEFWRIYLQNEILITQLKSQVKENNFIKKKSEYLQNLCEHLDLKNSEEKSIKKKNRRQASEIEKNFKCPYENCYKIYGSDVSLNLHIKLKHNGGNKTEREKFARTLILAEENGNKIPEIKLNFPPGFLDKLQQKTEENGFNVKRCSNQSTVKIE